MMSVEDARLLRTEGICPFECGEKDEVELPPPRYQFLEPRQGSSYRQWFVKDRRIRADVLYGQAIGEDARTPEELASDFNLPVEAVREAIEYCRHNRDILQQDWEAEEALEARSRGDVPLLAIEDGHAG